MSRTEKNRNKADHAAFDPKIFGSSLLADKYLVAAFLGCSPGSLTYKVKNRSLPPPTLWDGKRMWNVEALLNHFRNINR